MASENWDPNLVGLQEGRVKHLVKAFESLRFFSDCQRMDVKGTTGTLEKKINNKLLQSGQENHQPDSRMDSIRRWAIHGVPPALSEKQPNHSSDAGYGDLNSFKKCEGAGLSDQSDAQSSQLTARSECSFRSRSRRSRKEGFDFTEKGSTPPKTGTEYQKKQVKVTSVQPFKLRTEERGHMKGQEFMKKRQEMIDEEEKRRIPIAQGLPWTTDEPQILLKPQIKELTKPVDIKLHTESRAVERAEFDHLIEEKLHILEQQKLEEQRLQKLAEEEEIKRLRKEMVPYAQLMPFFDCPFVPKRSAKPLTIPKGPNFSILHHTKCSS